MSRREPTHPKIAEDIDDVEGHARRFGPVDAEPEPVGQRKVGGTPERAGDEDVEGHGFRPGALPESEGLRKVGGTPERGDADDVEGHAVRIEVSPPDDDDVEGHARRPFTDADSDVAGHSNRRGALPEPEDLGKVRGTPERAEEDDDVEGHRRKFHVHDDDAEGHLARVKVSPPDEDDVEGHGARASHLS